MDAIEAVRGIAFDLLLLDLNIPGCSGWDVILEIRKFNTTIKIIVVSGKADLSPEEKQIIAEHTSGYYPKPIHLPSLVQLIAKVLGDSVVVDLVEARPDELKGRREAREIVHSLNGVFNLIRVRCEGFMLDNRDGLLKDKSREEVLGDALKIMQDTVETVDMAKDVVDRIRKL